ncbi:Small-conductance mechanosensitive channel [Labilithrix luteola]|uniref:Small-conductance mechanosensitive channel n=2 Tax=Labilithrix luteola TaxID=1391654 RepID=A0A0K1PPH8_9BACT|nr:Small-conductance mechanosensitive channel [Labilithrix luteola]
MSTTTEPAIVARILGLMQWQVGLAVVLLALVAWLLDVALRPRWSPSRRRIMSAQFEKLRDTGVVSLGVWFMTEGLRRLSSPPWLSGAFGLLVLVAWMVFGLRIGRVFVFEWLFASTREGVPLLLVDLFTLAASLFGFGALLHGVFLVEVTSLLATSALASVVLGLAMQDTLGHLFAGISLQLDRPFRLGDWVEVRSGSEKISGQVLEVSWRATLVLSLTEELVTIPNKTVAQGTISNFSGRERPFVRSHVFRIPLDADLDVVRDALLEAARSVEGIVADPAPLPLVIETTESWIAVKMVNFLTDYGQQFTIGDAFHSSALRLLRERGIKLATARLLVERERTEQAALPATTSKSSTRAAAVSAHSKSSPP